MTKYIITLLALIASIHQLNAQEYMNTIVQKICECVEGVEANSSPEKKEMELGLCMLSVSMPYKTQLKKDFKIDLDKAERDGEKLGRLVGMRMMEICPNTLISMAGDLVEEPTPRTTPGPIPVEPKITMQVKGTVVKIEKEGLVILTLKEENGKTSKCLWLGHVQSENNLTENYELLLDNEVTATCEVMDIFDPKIEEYRPFYILKKINIVKTVVVEEAKE